MGIIVLFYERIVEKLHEHLFFYMEAENGHFWGVNYKKFPFLNLKEVLVDILPKSKYNFNVNI